MGTVTKRTRLGRMVVWVGGCAVNEVHGTIQGRTYFLECTYYKNNTTIFFNLERRFCYFKNMTSGYQMFKYLLIVIFWNVMSQNLLSSGTGELGFIYDPFITTKVVPSAYC